MNKYFIKSAAAFALICGAPLIQAQVLGGGATGVEMAVIDVQSDTCLCYHSCFCFIATRPICESLKTTAFTQSDLHTPASLSC